MYSSTCARLLTIPFYFLFINKYISSLCFVAYCRIVIQEIKEMDNKRNESQIVAFKSYVQIQNMGKTVIREHFSLLFLLAA